MIFSEFFRRKRINVKILGFTDFYLGIWYNICKVFAKMKSVSHGMNSKYRTKFRYVDSGLVEQTGCRCKSCYGLGCITTKPEEARLTSIVLSEFVINPVKLQKQTLFGEEIQCTL